MKSRKTRRMMGRFLIVAVIGILLSAGLCAVTPSPTYAASSKAKPYVNVIFNGRIWPRQACAVPVHTNWNYEYSIMIKIINGPDILLASGCGTADANGNFRISTKAPSDWETRLNVVVRGGYAYFDTWKHMAVVPGAKNEFKGQFIMSTRW